MKTNSLLSRFLPLVACLLLTATASAAVTARIDRPVVDLNESFTLEIQVDSSTDLEPDLTVLEENFYVGQVSQLSNTSIINSEIRRSMTWTVMLMAKRTGTQEIPPLTLGAESSAPVRVVVNAPTNEPPGEADVFVTSEVDRSEAYVQSQILYRIKIYRAVPTRQPALREPTIGGAEVLVEVAGDERSYEAVLNGRAYNVVERVIALYPQENGEITISPARFEARVLRDGRITGRKIFESRGHTVTVQPIPAPPADYPDAVWLPATEVQLSEEWSRELDDIQAGEPVTRRVTLSALGQLETQLPELAAPQVEGLNVYADKPEFGRALEPGGIRGVRKDQYAIIGVTGGTLQLPAVEVPWWDIAADEWRVATLPARSITVVADLPPPVVAAPAAVAVEADAADPAQRPLFPSRFWQRVSQLLAALWVLTLFLWWWTTRDRKVEYREPEPPPIYKQQAKILKAARKSAALGDGPAVRAGLLEWGRLQWPGDAPRSIGEFADRVAPPLSEELRKLSAASYGQGDCAWDGEVLATALRSITMRPEEKTAAAGDLLPPLMPPGV